LQAVVFDLLEKNGAQFRDFVAEMGSGLECVGYVEPEPPWGSSSAGRAGFLQRRLGVMDACREKSDDKVAFVLRRRCSIDPTMRHGSSTAPSHARSYHATCGRRGIVSTEHANRTVSGAV
jgi:hypothetical protein